MTSMSSNIGKSVLMMTDLEIAHYEERLYPLGYSQAGFLGVGERLLDVVQEDAGTLDSLKITTGQIADKLDSIIFRTNQAYENSCNSNTGRGLHMMMPVAIIDDKYSVSGFEIATNGTQECPFKCNYSTREDFAIQNLSNGKQIRFSYLLTHLIRVHEFFEGKGTSYRLDPRLVCEVLDLKSGVDYSKEIIKTSEKVWKIYTFESSNPVHEENLKKNNLEVFKLGKNAVGYLMSSGNIIDEVIFKKPSLFSSSVKTLSGFVNVEREKMKQASLFLHVIVKNECSENSQDNTPEINQMQFDRYTEKHIAGATFSKDGATEQFQGLTIFGITSKDSYALKPTDRIVWS